MLHLHARRHVDKTSTAEYGAIERTKFVIRSRNDFTEPFLEDLRILLQSFSTSDKITPWSETAFLMFE